MKPLKVLSIFDGISCARVAIDRAGIPVEVYYASEVDKYAIQISAKNYPDIVQLGDITSLISDGGFGVGVSGKGFLENANNIDLLIGGSPCQDLSIAKKDRKGLDGNRSGLFWQYVNMLKYVKPKYFILENVNSMPKEAKALITETLGVEPIMINASLVSAQNRKRLFWCGEIDYTKSNSIDVHYKQITITQPEDRGILLKDILEQDVDEKYFVKNVNLIKGGTDKKTDLDFLGGIRNKDWAKDGKNYSRNFGQGDRVYSPEGKSTTLSALGGGRGAKTGLYAVAQRGRNIVDGKRKDILGAKTEQRIEIGQSDKAHTITSVFKDSMVMQDTQIRKLTPTECERLQGLAEIEQSCIIRVCLGNQNNYVNVENQNHKLPSLVGNAEKTDSKQNVKSVMKSLNTNNPQTNKPVQPDVLINCEENRIEIFSQGKLIANVNGAELKHLHPHLKSIEDFAHLIVGLNTIGGKTTPFIEVELPQRSNLLVVKESGNNVVNIYGREITQLANDAKNDLITLKKLSMSTISDLFGQENKEQIIQTLFSFVALAIIGYIPKEMQNQNILTFQIKSKLGYTFGVSNSQRYKTLGNAFNVDVVAHILSFIN